MKFVLKILSRLIDFLAKKPSAAFLIVIFFFSVDRHHRYEYSAVQEFGTFYSDVWEYYNYLPEVFYGYDRVEGFDSRNNRRTIGMAVLYSPGFLLGHCIAKIENVDANGYTWPYEWAIRWWSIIFCLFGLFFLRKLLLYYFSENVTLLTIALVFFGTNLFFYTYSWGEMPHSYLFTLYSFFFYYVIKWIKTFQSTFQLFYLIAAGIIALVRPTGVIVLIAPFLFEIVSLAGLKQRVVRFFEPNIYTITGMIAFVLPFVIQTLIWKQIHGEFLYYSYGDERFNWTQPQILNFLFSYRKGWLLYTPGMFLFLVGLGMMTIKRTSHTLFFVIYFATVVYVLSSWWEWGYGGSFGCRALIESYSFFSFPIATVFSHLWKIQRNSFFIRSAAILFIYAVIKINLIQTWQYKYGIIHFSRMSKEAYWLIFLKENLSEQELKKLRSLYDHEMSQSRKSN